MRDKQNGGPTTLSSLRVPFGGAPNRDVAKLFAIATCVIVYSAFFRESRGLGKGVFTSSWMLGNAATTMWGGLMLALALTSAALLRNARWTQGSRRSIPDIRLIVVPAVLVLAWPFTVYEHNFFLNQSHLADRAGVVAAALLALWRPAFLGMFLMQLGVVIGHLSYPLSFSWTDKSPLIDALLLTQVYIVGAKIGWFRANHFLWMITWIVAVHYLRPGVGKLEIGWLWESELDNLVMGAVHQNAWLCFGLSQEHREAVIAWVGRLSIVLMVVALVIELLPLLYLASRRWVVVGLCSAIGLHVAIFATSGIFFWKWIILDCAVTGTVLLMHRKAARVFFGIRPHMVFCLCLAAGCVLYTTAPKLAWLDSPLSQRYHIQVIGKSGTSYQIPPSKFSPFDLQFAQGRLYFADVDPMIVDCFGSCESRARLELVRSIRTAEELRQVQSTHRGGRLNSKALRELQEMLRAFVRRAPHLRSVPLLEAIPDPPQHIWTFPVPGLRDLVWEWQEPADEVVIRKITARHVATKIVPLQDRVVVRFRVE